MNVHERRSESRGTVEPEGRRISHPNEAAPNGTRNKVRSRPWSVLLVVRHPVGGIRTFFRYVFQHFPSQEYRFTLIAPECHEARLILSDLQSLELSFVSVGNRVTDWEFFRAVTVVIKATCFDLIYSHGFTAGVSSVFGSLVTRTPHLLTCHEPLTDGQFIGFKGRMKKSILGLALATIDRIHCVSDDAKINLFAYLPILRWFEEKILAIRNGVEVERFLGVERRDLRYECRLENGTFLIGFLGRFMSPKGFRYLVEAMVEMRKRTDLPKNPVVLTFGGEDGFYREEMADIARRGLSDVVLFLPFVPNVASTLKGLDVVAVPSLWEACGLLAMEAMVAGVPVVGTSCIGLREVLADTPARVVPPRDASALAEALIAEMMEPTTVQAQEFAAVAAARFAVEKRAEEIERLMSELLEERAHATS